MADMLRGMSVEFVAPEHVRDVMQRISDARQGVLDRFGAPPQDPEPRYWESLFEANAAAALAAVPSVTLPEGYVVRYRFFGQRGRDLLVRPFVARSGTDVEVIRQLIDWHPAPDSLAAGMPAVPSQDAELLYRHFCFAHSAADVFDYWAVMQELWASAQWAHSHVIASAEELSEITAAEGWEVVHPVESYRSAVVPSDGGFRLAVMLQNPLGRFTITLHQIEIRPDQSLHYGEPVLVAAGRRGYIL